MLNRLCQKLNRAALVLALLAGWAALSGCQTQSPKSKTAPPEAAASDDTNSLILHEGDTLRIAFPGAASLDSVQKIRTDGKITLEMVGELKAAGLTATNLEQEILKAYGDQLAVKEVSVVVQSSTFIVFVTGAVAKPGKLISDRVETPLQAVIEAGVVYDKANLKKVVVIRHEPDGKTDRFPLNLDDIIKKTGNDSFVLQSMDTIYVPEKLNWF
ncbi:MAG TPA: polysaccharide biosynthesis/export family protein [Verrucomicrobiae bacterium]